MARRLEIQIIGDSRSAERALGRTSAAAATFGSRFAGVAGKVARTAALVTGAAGIGGLALTLKAGADEWMQQAKVAAQTEAALKSTGNAANVTKKQIEALAQAQMLKTGIDDELIQSGQNLLLTFKNVRNEVGEGNKVFDRATVAALDLSQAGFGSIESASKMLGKALNDPVKGMTAMSRAGVTFSQSQKDTIKALVASGKTLEAQKLILKEVESQVGGSAAAFGKTLPGQIAILKQSFANLAGELVGGLMPSLTRAVDVASKFVAKFSEAKGWRAKLNIVWGGVQEAGQTITAKIGAAIAMIDWGAVWSKAQGIGEGLAARFESINWSAAGKSIGDGIAVGVGKASAIGKKLADSIMESSRTIDWTKLGKAMGPGITAAMVTAFVTLLDPAFWAKNWDLALAVALTVFGRGIGKLVAPIGRFIGTTVGGAFANGILAIVSAVERLAPRIASAFLAGLLKLPGLVSALLGRVYGIVATQFGKLGRVAQFVVKVLGIQAAIEAVAAFGRKVGEWIERVVKWFAGLPGRIRGAIPNPGSILSGIGTAIISGLWNGLQSKWREVAGWLGGLGGAIKGLKGPKAKDAVLLVEEGRAIIGGLGRGMQAEWVRVAAFLRGLSAASVKEINALQSKLNAITARREAEDRAAAVRQAEAALAEARKKKEGVAEAERALARAREDIIVAGFERQLAREQALYDKRQTMIQSRMDKLNAVLQKAQDKAASTFNRMQSKIMQAFDATRGGMRTPAEEALAAISDRRRQEDLTRAVSDAQHALSEALQGNDPRAVESARLALARAEEDVHVASLERQAENERRALDQQTESMRERLQDKIDAMAGVWRGGTDKILNLLNGYGINFATVGQLLGEAFRESLIASIRGSSNAAGAVSRATANVAVAARARGTAGSPPPMRAGGSTNVTVNMPNYLGDKREAALAIRDELIRHGKANGSIFVGYA